MRFAQPPSLSFVSNTKQITSLTGSAADIAGIRPGDRIKAVDGIPLTADGAVHSAKDASVLMSAAIKSSLAKVEDGVAVSVPVDIVPYALTFVATVTPDETA